MREPVIFNRTQIYVGELLQHIDGAWSLDSQLRVGITQFFDVAVLRGGIFADPVDVFFASSGVNYQKKIVISEPVHDDVIHEGARREEHCGILGLTDSELGGIIHGDVLHSGQGAAVGARCGDANVAHVANVKNAHAAANGFMLRDQSPSGRVFDRHIPAAEIHHFRAQTAVDGI